MLSAEQIDQLFEFCKKHYVPYYDVQVELVDHLANAVEEQMENNPKLTFQAALKNVHTSFGVSGFAPLVSEKRKMAERRGRRLFWKLFKQRLRWPKILLFLLIVSFTYTSFIISPYFFQGLCISVLIFDFGLFTYGSRKKWKRISSTGKRFLVAEFSHGSSIFLLFFYSFVPTEMFEGDFATTPHGTLLIPYSSILIGISVILTIINLQLITSLNHKLQKDYPEVFGIAE